MLDVSCHLNGQPAIMKWLDNFLNKPVTNIFRLDRQEDYEYYQPIGVFLMFNKENGLLISAISDRISINIEESTFNEVCDEYGIEFNETVIQEVKPGDELYNFIGHPIKTIQVGVYENNEILGASFVINQGKYAGIIVASDKNKFTFYNSNGGWIWFEELTFPNKSRWILHQNGS